MPGIYTLPFEPNWANAVKYRITFPNKLTKSHDGHEQVILLRQIPVLEAEMLYSIADDFGSSIFDALIWKCQNIGIMLPLWLTSSLIEKDLASGLLSVPIPTSNPYFYVDTHIALINIDDNTIHELATVVDCSDGMINILLPLQYEWKANTAYIVSCRPAILPDEVQITKQTSNQTTASYVFKYQETPFIIPIDRIIDVSVPLKEDYTNVPMYKDKELFAVESNRLNDLNLSVTKEAKELDFTTGVVTIAGKSDHSIITISYELILASAIDVIDFVKWLYRRKGRNKPCWIPSCQRDVVIVNDVSAGSNYITVRDGILERLFEKPGNGNASKIHQLRSNIIAFRYDNTYVPIKLLNVDSSSRSNGLINLIVEPITEDILVDEISAVCFLLHVRLDSDTVEMAFTDKELAKVSFKMKESLYE